MTTVKSDIELWDGEYGFSLTLNGGLPSADEFAQTPSNLLINSGGGRFRRGDPTFSEYEQETWHGGRGGTSYFDDQSRFFDSGGLVTYIPGRLFLAPLWYLPNGLRNQNKLLSDSVEWKALIDNTRYISVSFTATAYTAAHVNLWIRRRGSPNALTFEICDDDSGNPGTVLDTVTKSISDIDDVLSVFQTFNVSEELSDSTIYHLKVYGASGDNQVNHWEVGVSSLNGGKSSVNNSTWVVTDYTMFYLVTDAEIDVRWHGFRLGGTTYAVSQPPSGNSVIKKWDETDKEWDAVSPTGDSLTGTVKSVCVSNGLAWFAKGTGGSDTAIMQFDHNAGTPRLNLDATATNKADLIMSAILPNVGAQLFLARNNAAAGDNYCIKRAPATAYDTDLAIGDTWSFEKGFNIIGMSGHVDNAVYARTQNRLYKIVYDTTRNDELIVDANPRLDSVVEQVEYSPVFSDGTFLYYVYSYSLEQMSGQTHDDIGLWKGTGMPDGRQGVVSCIISGVTGLYIGIDAGANGTSSVYFYDGRGWHEIWRAWKAGLRVRSLFIQPQTSSNPSRLFINVGNNLVYVDFPDNSLNPLNDPDSEYLHEGYIVSQTHDFGTIQLAKLFEALDVVAENLGQFATISIDYQVDNEVGTDSWVSDSEVFVSPVSRTRFAGGEGLGDKKKFRYRLRLNTMRKNITPNVLGTVLLGVARTVIKRQWNFEIKTSDYQLLQSGGRAPRSVDLYDWLIDVSNAARSLRMRSRAVHMDNVQVLVQPPRIIMDSYNNTDRKMSAVIAVSLLEVAARDDLKY